MCCFAKCSFGCMCCNDLVKSNLNMPPLGKCRLTPHFERSDYTLIDIFGIFRLSLMTNNGMAMSDIHYWLSSSWDHKYCMIDNLRKDYMLDSWEFILCIVNCIQSFRERIGYIYRFAHLWLNNLRSFVGR
jgi:hypothetical protein